MVDKGKVIGIGHIRTRKICNRINMIIYHINMIYGSTKDIYDNLKSINKRIYSEIK